MKKFFLSFLLLLSFSIQASEATTCLDLYEKKKMYIDIEATTNGILGSSVAVGGAAGMVAGAVIGSSYGVWAGIGLTFVGFYPGAAVGAVVGGAALGAVVGTVALYNMKPNRMIRLIRQANAYNENGYEPGRTLQRIHMKFFKINPDLSLDEFSKIISQANQDRSLCLNTGRTGLRKALKNLDLNVIQLD